MEAERKGRGEIQLGGAGRGATDLDFTGRELFLDMRKEKNKVSYR